MIGRIAAAACLISALGVTGTVTADDAEKVTYKDHVLPIFRQRCGSCHNANDKKGGLAVDSDYFAMFEVPFLYGSAWTRAEDDGKARVIVLGRKKSEKLFGNENPVGRTIHVFGQDFRIIGVRDTWMPVPRYTRLINSSGGALSGEDDAYIPFTTATDVELYNNASTSCQDDDREPGYAGREGGPVTARGSGSRRSRPADRRAGSRSPAAWWRTRRTSAW